MGEDDRRGVSKRESWTDMKEGSGRHNCTENKDCQFRRWMLLHA